MRDRSETTNHEAMVVHTYEICVSEYISKYHESSALKRRRHGMRYSPTSAHQENVHEANSNSWSQLRVDFESLLLGENQCPPAAGRNPRSTDEKQEHSHNSSNE